MSAHQQWTIECDHCTRQFQGSQDEAARDVRRYAQTTHGWHRTGDGRDLCNLCWEAGNR